MARIVYASEWDVSASVAAERLSLLRALRDAGHELLVAMPDLACATQVMGDAGLVLWQAPWCSSAAHSGSPAQRYTERMRLTGFADAGGLVGLAKAWRLLLRHAQPQLLLAHQAPVATLAARGWLNVLSLGDGFAHPPAVVPMPPFTPHPVPSRQEKADWLVVDEAVQAVAAAAWSALGANAPLPPLHEWICGDARLRLTWPSLDPYAPLTRSPNVATSPKTRETNSLGKPFAWVQLDAAHPRAAGLLDALARGPCPGVFSPVGLNPGALVPPPGWVLKQAWSYGPIVDGEGIAAVAVGHATHGFVVQAALQGVPMLLIPLDIEQAVLAHRLADLGAALVQAPGEPLHLLPHKLRALVERPEWREASVRLADEMAIRSPPPSLADQVSQVKKALANP